ncbi:MAG: cytochrome-c peroxidase [Proteobacteria bacterium]|nr:cytochrome-c peroxidase [Pseudomonadota bacterium]
MKLCLVTMLAVVLACCGAETTQPNPLDDFVTPFYYGGFTIPQDNPLTVEGVNLGRLLFYEKKLSADGTFSCGTCHQQDKAFTDGRARAEGIGGQTGPRNTMALANLLWGPQRFFWDGRAESLEHQALQPIENPDEMGETLDNVVAKLQATPPYPAAFNAAFGSKGITPLRMARALASFQRTLVSSNSKFDQYLRGAIELDEQESWGHRLFTTHPDARAGVRGANCADCHSQFATSGFRNRFDGFSNNGLDNDADLGAGLAEVTSNPRDRGKFKVPSLRNIELTAPYMHDGRFATLEEVIDHYNEHIRDSETLDVLIREASNDLVIPGSPPDLALTDDEKAAVIAFLRTLTDEDFIANENFSDPN